MAEQAIDRLNGGLAAGPTLNPSDKSAIALIEVFLAIFVVTTLDCCTTPFAD
jgi:hypothetical protein